MISKSTFWAVSFAQIGIAVAAGYVARQRGLEAAELREQLNTTSAKVAESERKLCALEKTQLEAKGAAGATQVKAAEANELALRTQLAAWQSAGNRAGIVAWLGTHANCVGRASDGRCNKYKLPEGVVLETDAPPSTSTTTAAR